MIPHEIQITKSFPATLIYYLGATTNVIANCLGSQSTTQGTLTSTAPAGTATLTKNNDNSFNIALASNDPSLIGQTL